MPQARDPDRRWYGVYANYDVPSYNTKLVKPADLPTSYEDFLKHKEWAGRVAVEQTDAQWLSALFTHYGEERARKLIGEIVATLKPVVIDGHLALARAVAAGEYRGDAEQLSQSDREHAADRRARRTIGGSIRSRSSSARSRSIRWRRIPRRRRSPPISCSARKPSTC